MELSSETEIKILEAATTIFLEKGKDGARMEEIAKEAEINQALLHYYFRSKDRLYKEVFNREVKNVLVDLFSSLDLQKNMHDFFESFISQYMDRLFQHPKTAGFILWEIRQGGETAAELLQDLFTPASAASPRTVVEKIKKAVEDKEIRTLDPHHLMMSVIGMCVFTFVARPMISVIFPEIDFSDSSFIDRRKSEIFNLIWNGIKP
jgi:TetR/AcrR family transcriptional regulator